MTHTLERARTAPIPGLVAWSLAGTAAAALGQWVVVVLLARLGTTEMVGQYALGLAVGAPAVLLAGLGLRTVAVTDPDERFTFADYLRLRVAGMLVALVLVAVAGMLVAPGGLGVVVLVGVAKALDGVGDVYFGLFQRHDRMSFVAKSLILNGVLTAAAMALLLLATGSVVWAALGSVVASAVASVAYCRRVAGPLATAGRPASGAGLRRLFRVALPLGVASCLASLSANLPRYVVARELGPDDLGVFAALGYVVLVAGLVFGAVSQVVLPRMSRMAVAGDVAGVLRVTGRLAAVTLGLGALALPVVAVAGRPALLALYGSPYAAEVPVLVVLTAAAFLGGVGYFLNAALSATRRFGNQLAVNAASLALCLVAAALLVPAHGLAGAAWAVLLAAAGDGLLKTLLLRRVPRGEVPDRVRSAIA